MAQSHGELERIAKLWGETTTRRAQCSLMGWLDSSLVLECYVQPKITGDAKTNWLVGVVKNLSIDPSSAWLSLGCGAAGQEIFASRMNLFKTMVACDASEVAIRLAHEQASKEGVVNIHFAVEDIGTIRLPAETYDVVLMNMALHHVRELEHLIEQVAHTLKPTGYFIANEYVGPSQFQFSDVQVELVRRLLACLPDSLKYDYVANAVKHEYERHSRDWWGGVDPSEANRSNEIPEVLSRYLPIVRRLDYGGTILHPLLEHIVGNFSAEQGLDVAILRLLALFEEILIENHVLRSDFTVLVAQKPLPLAGWKRTAARIRSALVALGSPKSLSPR